MGSKVSTLTVSLKDDVSGKAGQIGKALRSASDQARAMAKAMEGSGASKGFVNNLSRLGLSAKEIERVSDSLKDYTKAAGIAGKSSDWTKAQAAQVRAWETATVASLRHVQAEQKTLAKGAQDLVAGMGASGRAAAQQIAASQRLVAGMGAPHRAVEAARARAAAEAVETEHRRRASASGDMISGMGSIGRVAADRIAQGRRLAEGMGAPGRAAREQAAAEAAERAQAGRDARRTIAGAGLLYAGHKAAETKREVLEVYKEVDDLIRYQGAVADLTPEERDSRMKQAMHLGGTTRFNDIQALHAQLDLAQRGVKKQFVEPFVGEVVNYAQAMNADLGSAAKTLEGIVFATNQNVEDPATALKTMRRQVDLAVKMSKIGGLDNEDVAQAFKFGGASGSGAGLSNETMATVFALLRRSGYNGSEAGVAQRAFASKLVSPSAKGFGALDAMGVRWEDFTKLKRGASADLADNALQRRFGTKLTATQKAKFQAAFADEEIFGDQGKFITAATDIVSSNFEKVAKGKNKGKLKAQDAAKIAKTFSDLRRMLIESVDAEGLWDAILKANPTLAQANAWATDKHGGKLQSLARKYQEYKEYQEQLRHTPEGFAKGIGDQRNAGYAGAATRLEGSKKNLDSAIGQSLDNGGRGNGGLLTNVTSAAAHAVQSIAELPAPLLATGAAAAYLGGKLSSIAGAAVLTGTATGIGAAIAAGKGAAVASGAIAIATAAAPLIATALIGAILVSADKSKGIVHGGKNVDTRQDFSDELPGISSDAARVAMRSPSQPPGAAQPSSRAAEGVKSLIDRLPVRRPSGGSGADFPETMGPHQPGSVPLPPRRPHEFGPASTPLPPPRPEEFGGTKVKLDTGEVDAAKQKLDAIGTTTVAPKVDKSEIDGAKTAAEATKTAVEGLNVSVQPTVDKSSISSAKEEALSLKSILSELGAMADGVRAKVAGAAAAAGNNAVAGIRARGSSPSFSDGATAGP